KLPRQAAPGAVSPRARTVALASVAIAFVVGAPVLYFTRRYLDRLTQLARTDPAAATWGFKTYVLPQLVVIAAIRVVAVGWTIREGIRVRRRDLGARGAGIGLVLVGTILITVPTLIVGVMLALLWSRR